MYVTKIPNFRTAAFFMFFPLTFHTKDNVKSNKLSEILFKSPFNLIYMYKFLTFA